MGICGVVWVWTGEAGEEPPSGKDMPTRLALVKEMLEMNLQYTRKRPSVRKCIFNCGSGSGPEIVVFLLFTVQGFRHALQGFSWVLYIRTFNVLTLTRSSVGERVRGDHPRIELIGVG